MITLMAWSSLVLASPDMGNLDGRSKIYSPDVEHFNPGKSEGHRERREELPAPDGEATPHGIRHTKQGVAHRIRSTRAPD